MADLPHRFAPSVLVGIDVGGTFTDLVMLESGAIRVLKVPTTPDDPGDGMGEGLRGLGAPDDAPIVHGTTVATNALLERRGARTALLTTRGFEDVLAIGRQNRPHLYRFDTPRTAPLVSDGLRRGIPERVDAKGRVLQPLDPEAVAREASALAEAGVESIAVVYLFSFLHPEHERRTRALLEQITPGIYVTLSSDLLPEYREYERTVAAVVNAYVQPLVARYILRLGAVLGGRPVRLMQSNGGTTDLQQAAAQAARLVLSGPAGGVVAAFHLARHATGEAHPYLMTFDMGGTSTDVALCPGAIPRSNESLVDDLPLRLPTTDIHTVGAGGGSIARLDAGGALRVGPESAGARPGPACYGRGGALPTVTDANLVLGRLAPEGFGDDFRLDLDAARQAISPLASALGHSIEEAALGIVRVANATMERALRRVSIERGHDPREYLLVPFGGAGPLHACDLAEALDIRRLLIPSHPGVLSALGLILADPVLDASVALIAPTVQLLQDPTPVVDGMTRLAQQLGIVLPGASEQTLEAAIDLRYRGQGYELEIPIPLPITPASLLLAINTFHDRHEQRFGYRLPEAAIDAVTLRLRLTTPGPTIPRPELSPAQTPVEYARIGQRDIWFDASGPITTPIYARSHLAPGHRLYGPAGIVQYDTSTLLPPAWQARITPDGSLWLQREPTS